MNRINMKKWNHFGYDPYVLGMNYVRFIQMVSYVKCLLLLMVSNISLDKNTIGYLIIHFLKYI